MTARLISFAALVAFSTICAAGVQAAPASKVQTQVAQAARPEPAQAQRGGVADFGGKNNGKPINVEADKLEVFQKEGRAVYTGNVIAVQGETTMKCSQLVVFFDQSKTGGGQTAAATDGDSLKRLECKGPVSVVAKSEDKTQVATGANAIYDRVAGLVTMTGNVKMSDGQNISECATFTYNTISGVANCAPTPGGRVRGLFVPNEEKPKPGQ